MDDKDKRIKQLEEENKRLREEAAKKEEEKAEQDRRNEVLVSRLENAVQSVKRATTWW